MNTASITTKQKVTATITPTDVNGLAAPVFNQKWSVVPNADGSTGDCTIAPSTDGNSCDVVSASDATVTTVQCDATTTPDPESTKLTAQGVVAVGLAVQVATDLGFNFGAPTDK